MSLGTCNLILQYSSGAVLHDFILPRQKVRIFCSIQMMKFDMATYCPDWQLSAFRDVPVIQFFRAVHCTEDQHIVQCPPTIQIFVAMLCPDRQVSIVCGVQEILFYMAMRISCPDSHARFLKRPADAALRGQMPLQFCQRSLCGRAV